MTSSSRIPSFGAWIPPTFNPSPSFARLSEATFEKTAEGWKGTFRLNRSQVAYVELKGEKATYRIDHFGKGPGPKTTLRPDQAQELTSAVTRWMASVPGTQKDAVAFNHALRKLWKQPIEKLPTSVSNDAGTSARAESPKFWLNSFPNHLGSARAAVATFTLAGEAANDAHPGFGVKKVEIYDWATKTKVHEVENPKPHTSGVVGRGTLQQSYGVSVPPTGLVDGKQYAFVVTTMLGDAPKLEKLRTEPVSFEENF